MVSIRAVAGTACSQTRLKSETCKTRELGGRRVQSKETQVGEKEKEGKICRLKAE